MPEGLHGVVEIKVTRCSPPQMISGIDAVSRVLTAPLTIVETSHGVSKVTTADVALQEQLLDKLLNVGGFIELQLVDATSRQGVKDLLVQPCRRRPEANSTRDLVVPDRPRHRTPPPCHRQLVQSQQRSERLECGGVTQPRHVLGRFVDRQRDLHSLHFADWLEHPAEYVAGDDSRSWPELGSLEFRCDAGESADCCRTLHCTRVAPHAEVPSDTNGFQDWRGRSISRAFRAPLCPSVRAALHPPCRISV